MTYIDKKLSQMAIYKMTKYGKYQKLPVQNQHNKHIQNKGTRVLKDYL